MPKLLFMQGTSNGPTKQQKKLGRYLNVYRVFDLIVTSTLYPSRPSVIWIFIRFMLVLSRFLYIYLSSIYRPIYLSIYLTIDPSIHPSIYLSIYLSICQAVYLLIYYLFVHKKGLVLLYFSKVLKG